MAVAAGLRGLGRARPGHIDASDLLARPSLPVASQWSALAGSIGSLLAVLAGDDGGDDAAFQYAHGPIGGVCRSQASTSRSDPPGIPGGLCCDLDGLCRRSLSRR